MVMTSSAVIIHYYIEQSIIILLAPSPVNSLSIKTVNETTIVLEWISNSISDYVQYYTINYQPSCPQSSGNISNISFEINNYTLTGLYIGMNYTISMIAWNTKGQSEPVTITQQTLPTGIVNRIRTLL